ncbi:MAG: hypothetical protein U0003_01360 [Vampirovibrionales bacterium]
MKLNAISPTFAAQPRFAAHVKVELFDTNGRLIEDRCAFERAQKVPYDTLELLINEYLTPNTGTIDRDQITTTLGIKNDLDRSHIKLLGRYPDPSEVCATQLITGQDFMDWCRLPIDTFRQRTAQGLLKVRLAKNSDDILTVKEATFDANA